MHIIVMKTPTRVKMASYDNGEDVKVGAIRDWIISKDVSSKICQSALIAESIIVTLEKHCCLS